MKLTLTSIFTLVFLSSYAQKTTLTAQIINEDFVPEMGKATILNASDSSVIKGVYLDSASLEIIFDRKGSDSLIFKGQLPGFNDLMIPFVVEGNEIDLGEINFKKDQDLEAVKVVHEIKMFERTMDGITVNVEGTELQQMETLFDVLKASPKLTSPDNESIEIIGKGSPLILVDRQAIISNDELKAIPASQVEKIEIITHPSSKYKAQGSGGGVIEVYTKNFKLEGYRMTISLAGGVNTELQPQSNANIGFSFKKKKFSMNAYVGGNFSKSKSFGTSNGYTTDTTNSSLNSEWETTRQNVWQYFNVKGSYDINEKQKITLGVNGHGSVNDNSTFSNKNYLENNNLYLSRDQDSKDGYVWLNNRAFINYSNELDTNGSVLEFNVNYTKKVSEGNGEYFNVFESFNPKESITNNIKNATRDRPNIGESNLTYEHIFDTTGWKIGAGLTYSLVYNAKQYEQFGMSGGEWIRNENLSNSYRYNEHIGGGYFEFTKQWDKFGIRAGSRAEYTALDGYSESLNKQFIDSSYFNLFPGAALMYEPNDTIAFTLYYLSGIRRPQFDNFDPFIKTEDSLSLSYGNPFLKPTITHNIGLDVELFYSYSFSVSYFYNDNPVSTRAFINPQTFQSERTPWNADYEEGIELSFGIPIQLSWLKGWNSIWYEYTNYTFTDEFQRDPFQNHTFGFYSHLTAELPYNLSLSNRIHVSKWGNSETLSNWRQFWGMRLTKEFDKNGLKVFLDVNDIVPPKTTSTNISGNYRTEYTNQFVFTQFKVGVFFKLGRLKAPANIEESSSGQSDRI